MDYAKYQKWCKENRRPILVIPQGIWKMGNRAYADDGFIYIKGVKTDRYMVLQRYSGHDTLVRFSEKDNVHRFEALRWRVLERVKLLSERRQGILQELKVLLGVTAATSGKFRAIGEHKGEWFYIDFVAAGPIKTGRLDVDNIGVLDQLVTLVRSDEEFLLVDRYFHTAALSDKYWNRAHMLDFALAKLLCGVHPDYRRPWERPMIDVTVNGRVYLVCSVAANIENSSDYWPTPMRQSYSLDNGEVQELEPAGSATPPGTTGFWAIQEATSSP